MLLYTYVDILHMQICSLHKTSRHILIPINNCEADNFNMIMILQIGKLKIRKTDFQISKDWQNWSLNIHLNSGLELSNTPCCHHRIMIPRSQVLFLLY